MMLLEIVTGIIVMFVITCSIINSALRGYGFRDSLAGAFGAAVIVVLGVAVPVILSILVNWVAQICAVILNLF